ncbi:hypothetical protein K8I31_07365 [bacterium]|nr:hypothetical protein [bacterium]
MKLNRWLISKQETAMNRSKTVHCLFALFIFINSIGFVHSQEKHWYDAYFIPGLVNARLNYETKSTNYNIWQDGIGILTPDVTDEQLIQWQAAQGDERVYRSIKIINADETYFSEDTIVTSEDQHPDPNSNSQRIIFSRLIIDKNQGITNFQSFIPTLVEFSNPIDSDRGRAFFMGKTLAIRTACLQRMDFFIPDNVVLSSRQSGNITQLYEESRDLVFVEYETDEATGLLSRVVFYRNPNETRSNDNRWDVPINEVAAHIDSMLVLEYFFSDYIRHEPSGIPLPKRIEKKRFYRTRIENRSQVKLIEDSVDTLISFYPRDAKPGTIGMPSDGSRPRPVPGHMQEPIRETPTDIPDLFKVPKPTQ